MKVIDYLFLTKDSKYVVLQAPNLPITVAILGILLRAVLLEMPHTLSIALNSIVSGSLLFFAYLEIASGVNRFRRLLGLVVFTFTLYSLFKPLYEGLF